ncbi:hypothetical protein JHD47_04070 [Sulfurimonas sp. SAG-AH-194-L11]|nr:hypothetical protein [Sulfurimonas sp. SAG-AH-194-L11]MDF1876989.1 hypothetical protein [Sulfurimonas sp. SAG-AH-194-L11]
MYKKLLLISSLLFTTTLFSQHQEAKELFTDAECMSCHNNEDFVPREKKVHNFKKLSKAVDACRFNNEAGWFDDESLDVSKYLNHKFYKFKEE